jgi:hypothetical protein
MPVRAARFKEGKPRSALALLTAQYDNPTLVRLYKIAQFPRKNTALRIDHVLSNFEQITNRPIPENGSRW